MLPAPSVKRALGALVLGLLALLAGPASVLGATQPTPGYQPAFVTEREAGPWEDCLWAAAAMFLDKWTSGSDTVSRERLRALSGDRVGGSGFVDVKRAFDKLGIHLAFSPGGGARITWTSLLDRLAKGGGAIVLGDYHNLPARYGRWDRDFWARTGTGDDPALYLDRYDRRRGQILVMDPLAPDGWRGEWIPAAAIRTFVWKSGGLVAAAMTPPARVVPPFEGVAVGGATTATAGSNITVSWPVESAPTGWSFSGADLVTEMVALGVVDPVLPALQATAIAASDALPTSTVTGAAGVIQATIPVPGVPGLYRFSAGLSETSSGRPVAAAGPFALYVAGPRAGTIRVQPQLHIAPGAQVGLPLLVTNSGTESWADAPLVGWLPVEDQRLREIRLVGRWVAPATPATPAAAPAAQAATGSGSAAIAGPFLPAASTANGLADQALRATVTGKIDLGALHLETGDQAVFTGLVQAPARPGTWLLVFELIDETGRSLALSGSAPGIVAVDVTAPGAAVAPAP
jgi:hypothetical protein